MILQRQPAIMWLAIFQLSFAAVACRQRTEAVSPSALARLKGRCVRVLQPMMLVESGGEPSVAAYLTMVTNDANSTEKRHMVGEVRRGDEFQIERIVLARDFGGRRAIIVGRHR